MSKWSAYGTSPGEAEEEPSGIRTLRRTAARRHASCASVRHRERAAVACGACNQRFCARCLLDIYHPAPSATWGNYALKEASRNPPT